MNQDDKDSLLAVIINGGNDKSLIDSFFPEFFATGEVTWNDLKHVKELLSYFELMFETKAQEGTDGVIVEYGNSIPPSVEVFRLLFTLSSRTSFRGSGAGQSRDGFNHHNHYNNESIEYDPSWISLANRSRILLQRFVSAMLTSRNIKMEPYASIISGMRDVFMLEADNMIVSRSASVEPMMLKQPIMSPTIANDDFALQKDTESEFISDSEDEAPILVLGQTPRMENEVAKFEINNLTPIKLKWRGLHHAHGAFDQEHIRLQQFSDSHSITKSRKLFISKKSESACLTKVFDEDTLSTRLNYSQNNEYSVWGMIEWTFYCARLSSTYDPSCYILNRNGYHRLFKTYEKVAEIILQIALIDCKLTTFKGINTGNDLGQDVLAKSRSGLDSRLHVTGKEIEKNMCTYLLNQLDVPKCDMAERILNIIFFGLENDIDSVRPCYESDLLLLKSNRMNNREKSKHVEVTDKDDDNLESIHLRVRILMTFYFFAVCYSSEHPKLEKSIIENTKEKLLVVDYRQFERFFLVISTNFVDEFHSTKSKLMTGLIESLLQELCRSTLSSGDLKFISESHSGSNNVESLRRTLNLLKDERLYAQVVEDETYQDAQEFYVCWNKLIYLNRLLLSTILCGYRITEEEWMIKELEHADKVRIRVFQDHVKSRLKDPHFGTHNNKSYETVEISTPEVDVYTNMYLVHNLYG